MIIMSRFKPSSAIIKKSFQSAVTMDQETMAELNELRRLGLKYAWCDEEARDYLEKEGGVSLRKVNFYSSIPTVRDIRESNEYDSKGNSTPCYSKSSYRLKAQLALLGQLQSSHLNEATDLFCSDKGYLWDNNQFTRSDALHHFLLLRYLRPKRIVEIGSGWSSRITASAISDSETHFTCIDPEPRADLTHLPTRFIRGNVQDLSVEEVVGSLQPGDLLFVDSSHTIKPGGDCVYIYLQLLPSVPAGVYVHVHDIYLPYARPISHLILHRLYWYEDYLVATHVATGSLQPLLSNYFLFREQQRLNASFLAPTPRGVGGASAWFIKT